MTPEQFCYWLQGFAELNGQPPTKEQWESIFHHLKTVFKKMTPPVQNHPIDSIPQIPDDLIKRIHTERPPFGWPQKTEIIC